MTQAFAGVRIVDFSQVLAGPFATNQLALLGADVVKIEQPGVGDQSRALLGNAEHHAARMTPMTMSVNAGKRSLALDLKHLDAKPIVERLIRGADVVVQNFRVGVIDRLGFGYEAVKALNPTVVYCSVSGFGREGPKSLAPAYDGAIQAASGMMAMTGSVESGPMRMGFAGVDMATGITAAFAIAGALYRRAMTGEGQFLDVAMMDTALTMQAPFLGDYLNAGNMPRLLGNGSAVGLPTAGGFPTGEGYVLVSVLTDAQTVALCGELGCPELLEDPRFATKPARVANHDAMRAKLVEAFAADTAESWERRLAAAGVPIAAVADARQVFENPQLAHRRVLMRFPAPAGLDREMTVIGAGFEASADGPGTDRAPPTLGQHTDDVLAELGYDAAEIAALREAGAIG